jgi:hypothetical protein|nr:MAG TPA: hypothetical protein [Caudoviricetes sp.]DAM45121.1 MAG TPA: hypothetical protein [Caudoviricetes sp.]
MKTIGEIRCNVDNQKIESSLVEYVRSDLAGIIDMLEEQRTDKDLSQVSGEKQRLISIAQTKLEEACMFAVKALYTK